MVITSIKALIREAMDTDFTFLTAGIGAALGDHRDLQTLPMLLFFLRFKVTYPSLPRPFGHRGFYYLDRLKC